MCLRSLYKLAEELKVNWSKLEYVWTGKFDFNTDPCGRGNL